MKVMNLTDKPIVTLALLGVVLVVVGCGAPFEPAAHVDAGAGDVVHPLDVVLETHDAAPDRHREALATDVVSLDAGADVADVHAVDAPLEAEACALPPAAPGFCDGIPAGGGAYCIEVGFGTYTQGVTPTACRCVADYSCACILSQAADPCAGHGKLATCTEGSGGPLVQCT